MPRTTKEYLSAYFNALSSGEKTKAAAISDEYTNLLHQEETREHLKTTIAKTISTIDSIHNSLANVEGRNQAIFRQAAIAVMLENKTGRSELLRSIEDDLSFPAREIRASNNFVETKLAEGTIDHGDIAVFCKRLQILKGELTQELTALSSVDSS